jgi:hypothetical protein
VQGLSPMPMFGTKRNATKRNAQAAPLWHQAQCHPVTPEMNGTFAGAAKWPPEIAGSGRGGRAAQPSAMPRLPLCGTKRHATKRNAIPRAKAAQMAQHSNDHSPVTSRCSTTVTSRCSSVHNIR